MKLNHFRLIFFLSTIILLSSCLGTTTVTTPSTDATFVSLTFAANDSVPKLSTAVFTLVDTTIINVDSLPYKTRVDSVYPTFTFTSSSVAMLYFSSTHKFKKNSSVILGAGKDTIDFRQPIRVVNYAADGKTTKGYKVVVNVHQVDPEAYIWNKVSDNLNSVNATSQKTVILNDVMYYYSTDGTSAYLYTSTDGTNWNQSTALSGLPVSASASLKDMMQFNGKLYLTQNSSSIYSTSDGLNWGSKLPITLTNFTFKSLLYVFNDQLWAVVLSNDGSYHFATSGDGDVWNVLGEIPANFPVSDFASASYFSPTGKSKVLVLGGYSSVDNINPLKNRWSSEDGLYWVDFSTENRSLDTLAVGASVIPYDGKLLLFGSRSDNGKNHYRISQDEGLSWQVPDALRNFFPKNYPARTNLSAVVFKPRTYNKSDSPNQIVESNRIFIIGGNSESTIYSDVWTGKLNRKNFLLQ
ncbi:MAG: DUF6242 domain-containing protein [Bacteroidota bacterium]|nr:DUF6242 domain-containing protein [Bacteroidota bacterium]